MRRVLVTGMSGTGKSTAVTCTHELEPARPLEVVADDLARLAAG